MTAKELIAMADQMFEDAKAGAAAMADPKPRDSSPCVVCGAPTRVQYAPRGTSENAKPACEAHAEQVMGEWPRTDSPEPPQSNCEGYPCSTEASVAIAGRDFCQAHANEILSRGARRPDEAKTVDPERQNPEVSENDVHLTTVIGNIINRLLGIDAVVTHRADELELKCWTHDDEGGRSKTYLSIFDCMQLSNAFMFIGARLAAATPETSK